MYMYVCNVHGDAGCTCGVVGVLLEIEAIVGPVFFLTCHHMRVLVVIHAGKKKKLGDDISMTDVCRKHESVCAT